MVRYLKEDNGSVVLVMLTGLLMMLLVASIAAYIAKEAGSLYTAMDIKQAEYVTDSGFELVTFLVRDTVESNENLGSESMEERPDGSWGFADKDLIYLDFGTLQSGLENINRSCGGNPTEFNIYETIKHKIPDDFIAKKFRVNKIIIEGYKTDETSGNLVLEKIGEIVLDNTGYTVNKEKEGGITKECMFPFPVLTHTFRVTVETAVINTLSGFEVIDPRNTTGEFTVELRFYEAENIWKKEIDRVWDVSFDDNKGGGND
jgi:hypothetical protein